MVVIMNTTSQGRPVASTATGRISQLLSPRSRRRLQERLTFLSFVTPNFVLFAIFTFWPIFFTFYLSFTDWNMIRTTRNLVGLENYRQLVADSLFYKVITTTLIFAITTVVVRMALSLGLAILLNQKLPGQNVFRALVFSPHITTTAAAAMVWVFVFDPNFGLLKAGLDIFGIRSPNWLSDPKWALPAVIIVAIWKTIGFSTVIYLAGLQSVDKELQDAARVDGADELSVFRHVTLPLLTPVTFFLLITGLIGALQTFDLVAVMTRGGPLDSTTTYVYHLYRTAFEHFRAGYSSALAMVFFLVIMAITLLQTRLARRWVHY
jgi:ABC-type sugar transport system permease subunit